MIVKKSSLHIEFNQLVAERLEIEKERKSVEARWKAVNDQITEVVRKIGMRDGKGSYNAQYQNYSVRHEAYNKATVNEKAALSTLASLGVLDAYSDRVIKKEHLEKAVKDNVLDRSQAKELMQTKTEYRLMVREIKETEEDEFDGSGE